MLVLLVEAWLVVVKFCEPVMLVWLPMSGLLLLESTPFLRLCALLDDLMNLVAEPGLDE